MRKFKTTARFIVALICLTSAFLISIQFSDRGVQFDLRHSDGASSSDKEQGTHDLSALRILNRVLLHLKDSYVEPERINPSKMLISALEEIQNSVAEIVIDYDRTLDADQPQQIKLTVRDKSRTFDVGGVRSLWEMSFKLRDIFRFIQEELGEDENLKYQDIEYAAINGMLETLDPHSTLLPPSNYEEMQTQTGGKFGGLGIVISLRDGHLTVVSPIDGTPAAKKGIKARDRIVRIGEESTVNMGLSEAVNMLRGEPGTKVTLWVLRKGWAEARKYEVERAIIKIDSVEGHALDNKIGYIRIKNFQSSTYKDTVQHLKELNDKMGGIQGLVLDLRDNPGGLLDQSIKVSDLFLEEGTIVSTVGQGNKTREKKLAMRAGTESPYPIIVLVNSGSASASEIVSGALQNNDRGIVLGDTTFGKGSVQVIYEFPDKSALKLTVAQYLTPGNISIQGKGIIPDLRAIPVRIREKKVDMFLSKNTLREADLATALTSEATREGTSKKFIRYLQENKEPSEDDFEDPNAFKEDFEIKLAQKLLVAAGDVYQRPQMLETIQKSLDAQAGSERTAIQKELAKQGIDWSTGPVVKSPSYKMDLTTDLAEGASARAGDMVTMTATITNTGQETFHQLKAISESDNGILSDREFIFGKLAPGETRTWSVTVKLPQDMSSRRDLVSFDLSDANTTYAAGADAPSLAMPIESLDRPHFAFAYDIEDTSGDGLFQPDEEIKLKLHVYNNGGADSAETLVYLKNMSRDAIFLEKGRTKLPKIPKNAFETVEFSFKVKKKPESAANYEFELDIYDSTFREFTQKKFQIPAGIVAGGEATEQTGALTPSAKTPLYSGANKSTQIIGYAQPGVALPALAAHEGWHKVALGERVGWLAPNSASIDATASAAPASLNAPVLFESPKITVDTQAIFTDKNNVELSGSFTDDSGIKDYYVFVYNRAEQKVNTRKVGYFPVDAKSTDFKTSIPLFPGMNRVAIYVRDKEGMTASKSAYIYRTSSK